MSLEFKILKYALENFLGEKVMVEADSQLVYKE